VRVIPLESYRIVCVCVCVCSCAHANASLALARTTNSICSLSLSLSHTHTYTVADIKKDDKLEITISRGGLKKTKLVMENLTTDLRKQQELLKEITQADVDKIEHLLAKSRELMKGRNEDDREKSW
jgi:hypothetical protein